MLSGTTNLATYDGVPRPGIDAVDDNPDADDGNKPVTGMAEMLPQFDEADVEREQHDDAGHHADDKEDIVQLLFRQPHRLSAISRQKFSCRRLTYL